MTDPDRPPASSTFHRRAFVGGGILLGTGAAVRGEPADGPPAAGEDTPAKAATPANVPASFSGVVPRLGVSAGLKGPRSESGIGALMPWGGRLWFVTYTAHTARTGSGTGLFWVDGDLVLHKAPESVVGTYANRLVHAPSQQMMIGPHLVDADNNVRTVKELVDHRLTATLTHLDEPDRKVYVLGMEGEFWELDVRTLAVKLLYQLNDELKLPKGLWPHYKGGYTASDRVVVANNTYAERDHTGSAPPGGRLAEWDGKGGWTILEETAFCDVAGRRGVDHAHALAIGWDRASVILRVLNRGEWTRYRLPKASHAYDHGWYTEWPRIREVETERLLLDVHGMFYELSPLAYAGRVWGVKPISQHLRQIPDFCTWKGMLVLAGDQGTAVGGNDLIGEPQANLWLGKTDDLWGFGRPQGWGGPWYHTKVEADAPSDPFLMTGFVNKGLHLANEGDQPVNVRLEVDFLGDGFWRTYDFLELGPHGYVHHEFPAGFGAHWIRLTASREAVLTAHFVYT